MKSMVSYSKEENIKDNRLLLELYETIYSCSKPVIGRINGHAFGGGIGLIAVCDITITIPERKFAFSEANLGIIPSVISTYIAPRMKKADMRRFFITAERFDSETAYTIGLIDYVVTVGARRQIAYRQDGSVLWAYEDDIPSGDGGPGFLSIRLDSNFPIVDIDSDGDGVTDALDAFPNDPNESEDSDGDGIGNNSDIDNDNDGLTNAVESGSSIAISNWTNATAGIVASENDLSYDGSNSASWSISINSSPMSVYGFTDDYEVSWIVSSDPATSRAAIGLGTVERFFGFATQAAAMNPNAVDKVDIDQMIDVYGDLTGVQPGIVRPDDQVAQIRADRLKQLEQAQKMQELEQGAKVAKDMSQADTSGNNVLTKALEGMA